MRKMLMLVLTTFLFLSEVLITDVHAMGIFKGREKKAREEADPVQPISPQASSSDPAILPFIAGLNPSDASSCPETDKSWQKDKKPKWFLRCIRGCGNFNYYIRVEQTKSGRIEDFSIDRVPVGADPKDYTGLKDTLSSDTSYEKGRILNCKRKEKTESATLKVEAMAGELISGLKCPERKRHSDGSFHQGEVDATTQALELPGRDSKAVCLSGFNQPFSDIERDDTLYAQYKEYEKPIRACGDKPTMVDQKLNFALNGSRLGFRQMFIGVPKQGKKKAKIEVSCTANSCGGMQMLRSTALNNLADCDGPFHYEAGTAGEGARGYDKSRVEPE